MRFILLSFGFMGWAFYEMSGGSDFDAEAVRAARMAELEMEEVQPVAAEKPVVVAEAPKVFVDTDPPLDTEVTRVSLNLTTLEDVADADTQSDVVAAVQSTLAEVPRNAGTITSSADTPAIIPSLIDPTDGVTAPTQVGFQDIRTVSGNRVNVRGGPGTDFGIVGRLTRGAEIRVLEENGTGWVRFETTDGATGGWMADFLLAGG